MATPQRPPLIQFESPPEGLTVKCDCGGDLFTLLIHVKLSGALVSRMAKCARCGKAEPI